MFYYYGRGSAKNVNHVQAEGGCSDLVTNHRFGARINCEPRQFPHVLANDSILRTLGASLGHFDAGSGGCVSIISVMIVFAS